MPIDVHELDQLINQARRILDALINMREAAETSELRRHRETVENQIADREARRRRRSMGVVAWIGGGVAGATAALWHTMRTHQAATLVAASGLAGVVATTAVVARHTIPRPQARPPAVTVTATPRPAPTVTTTVTPSATPSPSPAPTSTTSPTATLPQSAAPPPEPGTPAAEENQQTRRPRRRPTPTTPGAPPTPPGRTVPGAAAPVCALGINAELAPVVGLTLCAAATPRP